jgi:hypothetical protein
MYNNLPTSMFGKVLNSRHVYMIPFFGLRFSLDQNPQVLISATITRVRINERGLTNVAKLVGSVEPNVQQKCIMQRIMNWGGEMELHSHTARIEDKYKG